MEEMSLEKRVQHGIDVYYTALKKEVRKWLNNFIDSGLKRLKPYQKAILKKFAADAGYEATQNILILCEDIWPVSKRERQKLKKYVDDIEWLPPHVDEGHIDCWTLRRTDPYEYYVRRTLYDAFGPLPTDPNYNPPPDPAEVPKYVIVFDDDDDDEDEEGGEEDDGGEREEGSSKGLTGRADTERRL